LFVFLKLSAGFEQAVAHALIVVPFLSVGIVIDKWFGVYTNHELMLANLA